MVLRCRVAPFASRPPIASFPSRHFCRQSSQTTAMDSLPEAVMATDTHHTLTWNISQPIIFASDLRWHQTAISCNEADQDEQAAVYGWKGRAQREDTICDRQLRARRFPKRRALDSDSAIVGYLGKDYRRRFRPVQEQEPDLAIPTYLDSRLAQSDTSRGIDKATVPASPAFSIRRGALNFRPTEILQFARTPSADLAALGVQDVDTASPTSCGDKTQSAGSLDTSPAPISSSVESDEKEIIEEPADEKAELEYQIPERALRAALSASTSSPAAYFSHKLYRNDEGKGVTVQYCRSFQTADKVARDFLEEDVLGFDIEWNPNAGASSGIKENVSLIQIASPSRVALFHIAKFSGQTPETLMPPVLRQIIESGRIIKTGVAILADFTRIKTYLNVEGKALMELSHLNNLVFSKPKAKSVGKKTVSLARQVEMHLQLPMWKGEVRVSNWARELSYEQCGYAASDAYAGLRLFDVLERKRLKLKPTPPRPEFAELKLPIVYIASRDSSEESTKDEQQEAEEAETREAVSDVPVVYPDLSEQCQKLNLTEKQSTSRKVTTAKDCEDAMLRAIQEVATPIDRLSSSIGSGNDQALLQRRRAGRG